MFCDYCGKKLPDDSTFCWECGAQLASVLNNKRQAEPDKNWVKAARMPEKAMDAPPMPESTAGENQPAPASSTEPASGGLFTRTQTLAQAAQLAIRRNPEGEWSYWDSPGRFNIGPKKLQRACEKEDREINSFDDRNGVQFFVVSPDGAIAQIYLDDNDENLILEWLYFTPLCPKKELPRNPEELPY